MDRNDMLGEPGITALIVPFVGCGDLYNGAYDSDKSYPLEMQPHTSYPVEMTNTNKHNSNSSTAGNANEEMETEGGDNKGGAKENVTAAYTYIKPIQPPIAPNYYTYLTKIQQK